MDDNISETAADQSISVLEPVSSPAEKQMDLVMGSLEASRKLSNNSFAELLGLYRGNETPLTDEEKQMKLEQIKSKYPNDSDLLQKAYAGLAQMRQVTNSKR
ncbi:hypothetical protein KW795_00855 [Candidatus Microgenomates bacterium]|nr:hypothetical protein [Candidatus Microgenomates bacterium]